MPQTELEFASSEFDVFARKPVQNAILDERRIQSHSVGGSE